MLNHPDVRLELARMRHTELVAAAQRHRLAQTHRRRQPGRARVVVGWALVDSGLRLVVAGARRSAQADTTSRRVSRGGLPQAHA